MKILVTGASGFLGKALLPYLSTSSTVYALSRHPPLASKNVIPLVGDITEPGLGLSTIPHNIDRVYHLAATHHLGDDKNGHTWETNVTGTKNVIAFCHRHQINQLYFCSTAYTVDDGRNTYEKSKIECERLLSTCGIHKVVIFKPSVVMGTEENPYQGHFSQFVTLLAKSHNRAEIIRRKVEGALRLPLIEPVLRVRGNPEGCLNLVTVDEVARGMAKPVKAGTYWLTNPYPPTLGQLAEWISKAIRVRFSFQVNEFRRTPIEMLVARKVDAFGPYLWGDSFPSHLKSHLPITREFIHQTILNTLNIDK